MFLFGALDPIHAAGDLSIASAGRTLEIIDVESKNTLITVTSSLFFPHSQGLCRLDLSAQSVGAVLWTHPPQLWVCCSQPYSVLWTQNQSTEGQTHQIFRRPSSTEINRGFGYLFNSVDLDLNDLSQGK